MKDFLKSTFVGGALFLLPLALLAFLFEHAVQAVTVHVVRPTATTLGIGGWIAAAIVFATLVFVCFVTGMFARSHAARRAIAWLENSRLSKLPQYQQFRSAAKRLEHGDDITRLKPVLLAVDGGWRPAFLIEEFGGFAAVYLPQVPEATTGHLAYIEAGRLRPLDLAAAQMLEVIWRYGIGSAKLVRLSDLEPP